MKEFFKTVAAIVALIVSGKFLYTKVKPHAENIIQKNGWLNKSK